MECLLAKPPSAVDRCGEQNRLKIPSCITSSLKKPIPYPANNERNGGGPQLHGEEHTFIHNCISSTASRKIKTTCNCVQ